MSIWLLFPFLLFNYCCSVDPCVVCVICAVSGRCNHLLFVLFLCSQRHPNDVSRLSSMLASPRPRSFLDTSTLSI